VLIAGAPTRRIATIDIWRRHARVSAESQRMLTLPTVAFLYDRVERKRYFLGGVVCAPPRRLWLAGRTPASA
jgi:hypothetical protein